MRVALYARRSDPNEKETYGLEGQLRELRARAEAKGYTIVEEYVDDGVTGKVLERPQLARLREAVRQKVVDVVLVHDPDRWARKLSYQLLLTDEIEAAGVRLEYVTMDRSDSPEGTLLELVKGAVAEYERLKIGERTRRGRLEKARRGLKVNGRAPYGYRLSPAEAGRLVIEPTEAAVVRQLYAWLVDSGWSLHEIARELTRRRVPARSGGAWQATTVVTLLRNEAYIGRGWYGRRQRVGTTDTWRARDQWIPFDVPPIVAPEVFAAVQQQLDRNRAERSGRPANPAFILRGVVRCGCGRRMATQTVGRRWRYYECPAESPCPAQRHPAPAVEARVWAAIVGLFRDPAVLGPKLVAGAARVQVIDEVAQLTTQLRKLARQADRLLDLTADDAMPQEAIQARLRALGRARGDLETQLAAARPRQAAVSSPEAPTVEALCALAARLATVTDLTKGSLLRAMQLAVTVREGTIAITGRWPDQSVIGLTLGDGVELSTSSGRR